MAIFNCIALEVDRYVSLTFLAFVERDEVADVERVTFGMVVVDTEEVLEL